MRRTKLVWVCVIVGYTCVLCLASQPGGRRLQLPKANAEATERLKEAYAAYVQGQYQKAIRLALEVYEEHGDVQAKWFPRWVSKVAPGPLPDPHNKREVLSRTMQGPFLYTTAMRSTFPSYLLARCYNILGDRQETSKWAAKLREWGYGPDAVMRVVALPYPSGHTSTPPKAQQRPLSLQFREEDYFILIPLDEACKVLGLSCSITSNPRMAGGKGIRVTTPHAPNVAWRFFVGRPKLERLENGKGSTKSIDYAPFEEDGKVWVPFYWLAKQAGIKWWEVRNGKIYVAPREGSGQGAVPSQKTTTAGSR